MKKRKLSIGLFGLGTVGSEVVGLLAKGRRELKRRYNIELHLKRIVEIDLNSEKAKMVPQSILTPLADDILNDPEIDTVIELIGSVSPAKKIILTALKAGKNVVTANKALLAMDGNCIAREVEKNNCHLGFRAAITGCHETLNYLAHTSTIQSITGIFNSTSNYILSGMEQANESMEKILKKAQKYGYAEQNPSLDIGGVDAAHKLIILIRLAFATTLGMNELYIEGISGIALQDIQFAREMEYRIRLLGIARRDGNKIEARVHPCLLPEEAPLSLLKGVENGIQINDRSIGQVASFAEGAGGAPAASAVISDLIDIAEGKSTIWPREASEKLSVKPMNSVKFKYYIRFNAENKPGVLARIASLLGKHQVNIKTVVQKEESHHNFTPIIMTTDEAKEENVHRALKLIDQLTVIREKSTLIRIEDLFPTS
ncbi:homoserine dehydrogenase [candidate division NPL-UPA2 bacterium Unc8]|uniref:Homoserine dehydrogenase n=1 Tax=candidate division NPL-UPA2 bacterium Unc8 TaxID=1980939 RepID=A0A399FW40_UNCN2|nr:Homoserine dehydrogenase [Bacillota bacterium]MBT9138127.1 Homoserine dehydrogenase [Bacillota bacterium]MBT9146352.1 Homoserine dehydrogenase [Bacillota bacterium]RII00655.1 MAG: homoserine dehydrogenase [candidate division NPL-UPA2 bacterium Unc8]